MQGAQAHIETDTPYLTRQIIAYIGNKRKLLSLIYAALEASGLDLSAPLRFGDLFSGSGVVSRFAKSLGFEVYTNDWEPYAEVLSRGFVETDQKDFAALFPDFDALARRMNGLPPPAEDSPDRYISRYYAAQHDDPAAADFRTERLFYTRQNALTIDKIRSCIQREYPDPSDRRRQVLLALLLYEAATHTNTSGVFKAFHKGFGGHGKDALSRILGTIAIRPPVLIDGRAPVHVYRKDANLLVRELPPLDVVYLDPPYNQHQYGSNYHILNTIALWDRIPAPLDLDEQGVLVNKAAIRTDWTKTRSPYCYKKTAAAAFRDLLAHIRARLILVSYSSDGIIPFEEMKDICLSRGYVSIVTSGYTVYRGGKQSNSRKSADIEFVLAIDTSRASDSACGEQIDRIVLERRLLLLLKRRYSVSRLAASLDLRPAANACSAGPAAAPCPLDLSLGLKSGRSLSLHSPDGMSLSLAADCSPADFLPGELAEACDLLESCACRTKQEELDALINLTRQAVSPREAGRYARQIPATLKKLAQKKYRAEFYTALSTVHTLSSAKPDQYALIKETVAEIARTAEQRFNA